MTPVYDTVNVTYSRCLSAPTVCGRATQALHPHLIEEPAQTPDLRPAAFAPAFDGDVMGDARRFAAHRFRRHDRLGLNGQVGTRRVDHRHAFPARAGGDKQERRGQQWGERQGSQRQHRSVPFPVGY